MVTDLTGLVNDSYPRQTTRSNGSQAPRVLLESTIALSGKPGAERLITDGQSLVVADTSPQPARQWPLARIADYRMDSSIGSFFLQIRCGDRWIDVLRMPGGGDLQVAALLEELRSLSARQDSSIDGRGIGAGVAQDGEAEDEDIVPEPATSKASNRQQPTKVATQVLALVRPFWASVLLLLALSVGAVAIDVVPPMLQRLLVDDVLGIERPTTGSQRLMFLLLAIVGGLMLIRLSATILAVWKGWVSSRVGAAMTAKLRTQLVEKLSQLPLAFYDRNQVGKLMSQVAYDTETLHTLIYHVTSGFLMQSLQLVGIGVMLFFLNPKLAVITILPMPLIVVGGWYFTRYLGPLNQHYWEAVGKQASALMGMLSGIRVVKAFVQEDREMQRFRESSGRLRDSRVTVDVSTSTFAAAMGLIFAFGTLAVWYIGGRDVLVANMTLGSLVAFLAYLAMFYTPLTSIAESTSWFANFFSTMQRMSNLIDAPSETIASTEETALTRLHGKVEFHDVTFGYDKARPVLKNISLSIAAGEMVGIVGRSGSGKSTLVSLISRLYEVDTGELRIDGIDVRGLNPRALRRQIGMVPQDPFLFRGSVAANITYGNPAASPEQILVAAQNADAHEFIMRMPLAYDTQLGEGGSGLSGGERQRLSIARAILFDPAILILDEATASVDAESEKAICEAIRRWAGQRTTILIAHRLSTLQDADRLFVFDQGRLVEQGSHEELLEGKGIYQKLAQLQWNHGGPRPGKNGDNLDHRPGWLTPAHFAVEDESDGLLRVSVSGRPCSDVFAVRAFPITHKDDYICLRRRDPSGREREVGLIRSLAVLSQSTRAAILRSLGRRYLFRAIEEIHQIRNDGGHVAMLVSVDGVRTKVQVDNRGDGFRRFDDNGLLLVDAKGNYYVIADRTALPRRQRNLLELYFGE